MYFDCDLGRGTANLTTINLHREKQLVFILNLFQLVEIWFLGFNYCYLEETTASSSRNE